MSVQEVIKKIIIDKPFFDNSGGGVTLSGGEPTLYLEYAVDLTKNLKEQGVHVLLETCGLFKYDRFKEMLFPLLDAIYFDIKIHDSSDHMRFCGTPNSTILDNFIRILEDSRNGGPPLLPRTPLILGITDTDANMHAIACFLKEHGVKKGELLPYNPLWHKKNWSIGCNDPLSDDTTMNKFMPRERIRHCRNIFMTMGIEV
jgi:pyruvate formate lyase activating enzyme